MKPKARNQRPPTGQVLLLCLMVLLCGAFARSTTPHVLDKAQLEATPFPTLTPTPAVTPSPTPEPTPGATQTADPDATPVLLGEEANIIFSDGGSVFPSDTPATIAPAIDTSPETSAPPLAPQADDPPTQPPAEDTGAPATLNLGASQPKPGPTPTYEYTSDTLRVEVTRREIKNVVYFAAEIWLSDVSQLRSAFSRDRFDAPTEPVSDIAQRNEAVLAINGDFATFNNGGIIIRDGEIYRANKSTRHLLVIDQNGDFIPYTDPPDNPREAAEDFLAQGVRHTLVFGPVLVSGGEAVPLPDSFFINTSGALEPRTVVAQLGPLHYLFIVVDGRQANYSQGVSLQRMQELCLELGAQAAFNLDGGGSSTMYFRGNIINQPANGGQRHVPDILLISE